MSAVALSYMLLFATLRNQMTVVNKETEQMNVVLWMNVKIFEVISKAGSDLSKEIMNYFFFQLFQS